MGRKKGNKSHDALRARNKEKQESKKARLMEVDARQITVQPVSQTTIVQEQPKPMRGRPKGVDKVQRRGREFDVVDGAEKETQLGKRSRTNITSPDNDVASWPKGGPKNPTRSHTDYFREKIGDCDAKEVLAKRVTTMSKDLNIRDTHFVQRLCQLHLGKHDEKQLEEMAEELTALDELAEELEAQNERIVNLEAKLQLATKALHKSGCAYVALLLHSA
jgi:hypothetical protein